MVYPLRIRLPCEATTTKRLCLCACESVFCQMCARRKPQRIMRAWFSCTELLSCALCAGKVSAGIWGLQFVSASVYGVGIVNWCHGGINHGTHPNSGGVAVTVAITLRLPNGTQQSGDTMPRGVSGIPSGLGHDTVNPWDATSLRPAKNSALGLGADTILGELCPIGSIVWLIYTIVD